MNSSTAAPAGPPSRAVGLVGLAVSLVLLVAGLAWAKWLPYADKTGLIADTGAWPGGSPLASAGEAGAWPTLAGAWQFAVDYAASVWRAALVALLVAAAVDSLVPEAWLRRALGRRTRIGQTLAGGASSMPSMMCTCCTAPVAVGLRRRGAPLAGSLAYWLGNPLLNPAVLVFLALVLPWQYVAVRALVGAVLVFGVTAVVARLVEARRTPGASAAAAEIPPGTAPGSGETAPRLRDLPGRYLRSLVRFTVVLVPEYAVVVLATGLLTGWLSDFGSIGESWGLLAVVVVALVGTALVIPTGGEIPVIAALAAAGSGLGLTGALLITLPALSLPSIVMVGRALSWRATWATAAAVAAGGVVAGGLLTALT